MKRTFLLLAPVLLAAVMAAAQSLPGNSAEGTEPKAAPGGSQSVPSTQDSPSANSQVIRGCLSGSSGNYTLTDRNGMQYQVNGDNATLRSMVGREVEITGVESSASTNQGDDSRPANGVTAAQVRAISSTCTKGSSVNTPPAPDVNDGGVSPDNGISPKSTPQSPEPPPTPKTIAMLQQQSKPEIGTDPNGAKMTNPPVSSETPATPQSPMGSNSQVGASPANATGTTPDEANREAQAARQGELNTNPKTGETTGRGIENQGVNNPSQTNPGTVPTSRNSGVPGSQVSNSPPNDKDK